MHAAVARAERAAAASLAVASGPILKVALLLAPLRMHGLPGRPGPGPCSHDLHSCLGHRPAAAQAAAPPAAWTCQLSKCSTPAPNTYFSRIKPDVYHRTAGLSSARYHRYIQFASGIEDGSHVLQRTRTSSRANGDVRRRSSRLLASVAVRSSRDAPGDAPRNTQTPRRTTGISTRGAHC